MKNLFLLFNTIFIMISTQSFSQDISSHLWKNRLLLLLTDSANNKVYDDQLAALRTNSEGLIERKLIIYKITPDKYNIGLDENNWIVSSKLYNDFKKDNNSEFEVILIGLDGGIKARKSEFMSIKELFGRIDSMPMRLRELERKN